MGDMVASSAHAASYARYETEVREHGFAQMQLAIARELADIEMHRKTTAYNHAMALRGDYKIPPREVRRLTAKAGPRLPAKAMIVFTGRGDVIVPELLPHWEKQVPTPRVVMLRDQLAEVEKTTAKLQHALVNARTEIEMAEDAQRDHRVRFGKDMTLRLPRRFTDCVAGCMGAWCMLIPISFLIKLVKKGAIPMAMEPLLVPTAITAALAIGLLCFGLWIGCLLEDMLFEFLISRRRADRRGFQYRLDSWKRSEAKTFDEMCEQGDQYKTISARYEPIKSQTV